MCALAKKNSHCPASICNGCLCVCLCVCVSNAVNNGKETRKSTFCARCHRPNRTAADTLNFAVNCFQNRYCRCDPWACGVCVWERRRVSRNGYGDIIIIIIFYYAASGRTHTFRAFFCLFCRPSAAVAIYRLRAMPSAFWFIATSAHCLFDGRDHLLSSGQRFASHKTIDLPFMHSKWNDNNHHRWVLWSLFCVLCCVIGRSVVFWCTLLYRFPWIMKKWKEFGEILLRPPLHVLTRRAWSGKKPFQMNARAHIAGLCCCRRIAEEC